MKKQPKKKKQISWHKKFLLNVKQHKLITFLIVLVLLFPANLIYSKYLDWDNAQLINGLANDFPALAEEIEKETGLDLDVKISCSTTSEKYTSGVKTCELLALNLESNPENTKILQSNSVDYSNFTKSEPYENGKGFDLLYRNSKVCGIGINARGENTISVSCLTHIRDANVELAKEVFSNK